MRHLSILFCLLAGSIGSAKACGTFFSEAILWTTRAVLDSPRSVFAVELETLELDIDLPGGLVVPTQIPEAAFPPDRSMTGLESEALNIPVADLIANTGNCRAPFLESSSDFAREIAEMASLFESDGTTPEVLDRYRIMRHQMQHQFAIFQAEALPKGWPPELPAEFHDYLAGALAWRRQDYDAAETEFQKLLDRPLEERRYRSIWAAYMLARIALKRGDDDFTNSLPHFRKVLTLREQGCADTLGLGWDALAALATWEREFNRRPEMAARYTFALTRVGHRWSLAQLKQDPMAGIDLETAARDPFLRSLKTASLTRRIGFNRYGPNPDLSESEALWLGTLERLNVDLTPYEASRLAWVAYDAGRYGEARRWNALTEQKTPLGFWLEAKFAVQSGRLSTAESHLKRAESGYPRTIGEPAPHYTPYVSNSLVTYRAHLPAQFWADLAVVRMGRDDYLGALDAFMHSGHERDAAYIAEQLLSREELLAYVRSHWPSAASAREQRMPEFLRYLTARRLARDHFFKDARLFYPIKLLPVFDHYVMLYRTFRDKATSESDRASVGWELAQLHRTLGMELFGTSLAPDWHVFGMGTFGGYPLSLLRLKAPTSSRIARNPDDYRNPLNRDSEAADQREFYRHWNWDGTPMAIPATYSERWRFRHYATLPNVYRFHYRHVAADLAWEASQFMPIENDATARTLGIAGNWIKAHAPQPADRFYKSMIRRNRSTALAREADARRWFPEIEWSYDPWAAVGVAEPEWPSREW